MFDPANAALLNPDPDGSHFIDRSPDLFAPILEFSRTGHLDIPEGIKPEALWRELDFYGLLEATEDPGTLDALHNRDKLPIPTARHYVWMEYNTNQEGYINLLARRSVPVLHRAFKHKITRFHINITSNGTYTDLPHILTQTPQDRQFWQDFSHAISFAILSPIQFCAKFMGVLVQDQLLQIVTLDGRGDVGMSAGVRLVPIPVQVKEMGIKQVEWMEDGTVVDVQGDRQTWVQFLAGLKVEWKLSLEEYGLAFEE
ncbi:hypothetical protein HDV00_009377 [Rhizophlyctis rosea]|nr:hypothetical protein HDV00_009377 [Rhizophlyctis rosea]